MAPRRISTATQPQYISQTQLNDGFVNLVNSLGTLRDPRTSTSYGLVILTADQLLAAYRSNWLARRIVDSFADDATREWREWHASDPQIQAIEDTEKHHGIQGKVKQALVRARLFGGAALVMGVDGTGDVSEPLDLERVKQDSLKFVVVMSSFEMSRGTMILDVDSEWFGRPEYYRIGSSVAAGAVGDMRDIHPSRVIEFQGAEIPDWSMTSGSSTWGDPVLQVVDDVLKDYGTSIGAIASLINDCKVDVFKIPGFTKNISTPAYESKMLKRFSTSATMKSTINAMAMDKDEEWERVQTNFGGINTIMSELLKVVAGAAGIPMTRLVGHGSGTGKSSLGGKSGGESDLRNYYDAIASQQRNDVAPRLAPLDEVLQRSATGTTDEEVYYEWTPLYTPDPSEAATIAVQKATAFASDVGTGLINPDVLRDIRLNQLVEDGLYPGLEHALDEHGAEPPDPSPDDIQNHLSMLQKSSQQLGQIGRAAQPLLPPPAKKPVVDMHRNTVDGRALARLRMLSR